MTCAAPAREEFSFDIEVGGAAPSVARGYVVEAVGDLVQTGTLERLKLLVSELVTNVVRHASTRRGECLSLTLRLGDDDVRVEVADGDARPFDPTPAPDPDRGRGYGLFLVESLSSRWGVEQDNGTRVWFELELAG
jgi:anti-sigma regulatory factor (Ser/Thr protein kinase)